ncbi:class I SAM-dependent methyltransferase [Candidatus Pacearchaeota archaeon]|nr:class I SAM-dependent methyltransferase [Candidatus Pacearchaeota archaeon]
MKIPNQKKLWNNIAPEWHQFKEKPATHTTQFLQKQSGCVLDLGSGSGRHLIKLKNTKIYLVDFSEKMIKLAKEKAKKRNISAEFLISEIEKLPFENNFFDAAICINSLHCLETDKKRKQAIKELYRVLKPGAKAKIDLWNKNSRRFKNSDKEKLISWREKGKRYYYLYEQEEAYNDFRKTGFKIIKKEPVERSIVFIVEKPNNN